MSVGDTNSHSKLPRHTVTSLPSADSTAEVPSLPSFHPSSNPKYKIKEQLEYLFSSNLLAITDDSCSRGLPAEHLAEPRLHLGLFMGKRTNDIWLMLLVLCNCRGRGGAVACEAQRPSFCGK